jgi:IclR family transcriptional regulator, acetate operon repressor
VTTTEPVTDASASGTLLRGLDILERVAASSPTVPELAAELGLSRSAAYRITTQLRERGYLVDGHDGRLLLGRTLVRLGLQALDGLDVHSVARPHLLDLMRTTEETAFIAVFDDDQMAYVMQEVGPQVVKVLSKLGSRAPLHASGLGKAWLSALPESEAAAILDRIPLTPFTPTTLTSRPALDAELASIRSTGLAIDDAEREPGVRCLAAPILGASGEPVAAISVAGPRDRIAAEEPAIAEAVLRTAARISSALGAPGASATA